MIHRVPNLGRDLGSLVELAGAGVFDGYDAILKVHTKRSPHRIDGDAWRVALLDGLLPSPEGIRRIIELLRRDRSCGARRAEREPPRRGDVGLESGAGRGTRGTNSLRLRSRPAALPGRLDVLGAAVGSPPARGSSSSELSISSPKAGHVDGSTAHALERFVGVAAQSVRARNRRRPATSRSRLHRARRQAAPAAEGARLLPAAVPPDPRERRLVGDGVHRLGERRSRPPALRESPAAGRARRARTVRPVGSRCDAPPGGAGRELRRRRIRHVPLLVRRAEAPRHAVAQPARRPDDRLPLRALLGERELDAALGRPRLRGAHRAELQRGLGRSVLRRHPSRARRPPLHRGRRAAAARPLPRRANRERRCGDRAVEGARAGRRPRRPARPGREPFPAFRGAAATASRTSSTDSCGFPRWPA